MNRIESGMSTNALPALPPARPKRREMLGVRLTKAERRRIEVAARKAEMKASEWARNLLLAAAAL